MQNKKSQILMFGWEFPPYNSGGLGVACLGLTKALVNQGVEVKFVLPRKFELNYDHMEFLFADTSQTITYEVYEKYSTLMNPYGILKETYEAYSNQITDEYRDIIFGKDVYEETQKYAILAEKIARTQTYDTIHCHDWLTAEAGMVTKKISGKPLIFHVHATEIDRTGGHVNQKIYDIERKVCHFADKIIAVSEFTKQTLIKHYALPSEKIQVVHNGIDYYLEKSAEKDQELITNLQGIKQIGYKLVTFIGRLTFQKGADYFLEAAKIALSYNPKIKFILAGSGDMEKYLLEKTASLGLSNGVIFPGFLRDAKLRSVYSASDLFIMPSVYEPFGLVALEAMTHETPTIVSKTSGVAEVLSHVLTVDFWDVEELAHLILSILNHKTLYHQLKSFGHQEVQKISWDVAASKVNQVYLDCK